MIAIQGWYNHTVKLFILLNILLSGLESVLSSTYHNWLDFFLTENSMLMLSSNFENFSMQGQCN